VRRADQHNRELDIVVGDNHGVTGNLPVLVVVGVEPVLDNQHVTILQQSEENINVVICH
jgi:hypothetical protein